MSNLQSNLVSQLVTKDLNMHGRKVVNAADAVNPQDYVTLKQLQSSANGAVPGTSSLFYYYLTVSGTLSVANDVAPRIRVFDRAAIQAIWIDLKTPAAGASIMLSIIEGTDPPINVTIPAGVSVLNIPITQSLFVSENNYFTINITQVGSTTPGSDLTISIKVN